MHKARAFFFVCAGLFLLALAYHLGAVNARAQVPGNPIVDGDAYGVLTANGDVYKNSGGGNPADWISEGNVFASAGRAGTVVAGDIDFCYTADGDFYRYMGAGEWVYCGNLFTTHPTPAQQQTLGQVKARYLK